LEDRMQGVGGGVEDKGCRGQGVGGRKIIQCWNPTFAGMTKSMGFRFFAKPVKFKGEKLSFI
jgi:hypothetical protein